MTTLSSEQERCVEAALAGLPIFVTGGAGTGKSATLEHLIARLKARYSGNPKAVAVVAPTGVAALNVKGQTLHSWGRFGQLTKEGAATHRLAREPWLSLRVMVIDEISMVADWLLDLLDRGGRMYHNRNLPFGGIQMIFCGDFLQLAPIEGRLCFHAASWKALNPRIMELSFAFRQGTDAVFAKMLAEIRLGTPCSETLAALCQVQSRVEDEGAIEATHLYARRANVDEENAKRLDALPGISSMFQAQDSGQSTAFQKADSWTNAPAKLVLKVNAQVVLLKNLDVTRGLVNGSRGVVVGFAGMQPVVRFACGETRALQMETWTKKDDHDREVARRTQYPLALAWALTIHKSQGMSMDAVHIDLSSGWSTPGMAYVALSRCRTLAGLSVRGLTAEKITASADALEFYYPPSRPMKRAKHVPEIEEDEEDE
jgi:ATP-dependent DNA helicase PIF1